MKVVVERSKWCRGGRGIANTPMSALKTTENTFCCLGFACLTAGVSEDDLYNISGVGVLAGRIGKLPVELEELYGDDLRGRYYDSDLGYRLMDINDARDIPDDKREKLLTKLGRDAGIEFEFVDGTDTKFKQVLKRLIG